MSGWLVVRIDNASVALFSAEFLAPGERPVYRKRPLGFAGSIGASYTRQTGGSDGAMVLLH